MARGNAAPRGGTGANPPFSFAERKCAVDGGKETTARPGQGFGRDPSAGGYDGSWAFCRTSVRGNNPGEEFGGRPGRLTIAGAVFLLPQIGGRIGGCVGRTPNAPAVILLPQSGGRRSRCVNLTRKPLLRTAWRQQNDSRHNRQPPPRTSFFNRHAAAAKRQQRQSSSAPGKPRKPFPDRSLVPKCGADPNSRRNSGAGIPAKALAGTRRCFFSTVNGAFSFRERKWGVGSRRHQAAFLRPPAGGRHSRIYTAICAVRCT